jgi:hypothetical protein
MKNISTLGEDFFAPKKYACHSFFVIEPLPNSKLKLFCVEITNRLGYIHTPLLMCWTDLLSIRLFIEIQEFILKL